jgi:hypothetical protein
VCECAGVLVFELKRGREKNEKNYINVLLCVGMCLRLCMWGEKGKGVFLYVFLLVWGDGVCVRVCLCVERGKKKRSVCMYVSLLVIVCMRMLVLVCMLEKEEKKKKMHVSVYAC